MERTLTTVPYGSGHLAALDYGGTGPDVLLVPTLGSCAPAWDVVAQRVDGRCRLVALDPPGHAQSSTDPSDASDAWRSIIAAVGALGLERPVLVGHDHAASFVAQAALADPELAAAVIAVGGSLARGQSDVEEIVDLIMVPEVADGLRRRFSFGAVARDPDELERLVAAVITQCDADLLTLDNGGAEREVRHSLLRLPDGTHMRRPRVEAIQEYARITTDRPLFPDNRLARGLRVPTWLVQLSDGDDTRFAANERTLARSSEYLHLVQLTAGQWPMYSAADELAELIVEVAVGVSAIRVGGGGPAR